MRPVYQAEYLDRLVGVMICLSFSLMERFNEFVVGVGQIPTQVSVFHLERCNPETCDAERGTIFEPIQLHVIPGS